MCNIIDIFQRPTDAIIGEKYSRRKDGKIAVYFHGLVTHKLNLLVLGKSKNRVSKTISKTY